MSRLSTALGRNGRLLCLSNHCGGWPHSDARIPRPPDPTTKPGPSPCVLHQVPEANPAYDCQELYRRPSPPFSCAYRLPFTIFQGGMPRASYGDRHCISVVHNGQQTAFDFTSRVIDFTVLTEADPAAGRRALEVGVLGRYKNEGCHVDVFKPSTLPGPLALSSFFIPMTPVNPPLPPLPILPGADPI